MSVDITIQVPDELGRQLERYRDRLPELLELGLRQIQADNGVNLADEKAVITLLASRPSPEQVLALQPSAETQTRFSNLLRRGKDGDLTRAEEIELERYLLLEHLVRLAKAHAHEELAR